MSVFNPDDPIKICNGGGESIEVQKVLIELPSKPKSKKDILNWDKKKSDQRWGRTIPPAGLKKSTKEKYSDFMNQELDRIEQGFWMYNCGEAVFLTGLHYYYINYVKIDIGYPEYRERDRLFFYFWEAARNYKKSTGVTLVKPRRMGASWFGGAMLLYYGSQIRGALLGILSKRGKDAKSFFKKKLVREFKSLPFWLQPTTSTGTNPTSSLNFEEPARRGKETAEGIEESEALDTVIEWQETTENSFDGEKLYHLMFDEVGKLPKEISLETLWEVLSKCLYVGLRIVGKAFLPSTVNDLDKGGEQFKLIFMASRISEMEFGKTPTGLWAYFVPAYDGLEGYIDTYGRSVIDDPVVPIMGIHGEFIEEGSKTALARERILKKKISKKAYLENVRQFPWNVEEAFYFNSNTAVLDTEKIAQQISYEENERLNNPVKTGNFLWAEKDKEVVWIPSENGRFKIRWLPPRDMQNQYYVKNGKKKPMNEMYGAAGLDPYVHDSTVDGRGSKGGMHFHTKKVLGGRDDVPYYQCIVEYINRPPTAKEFFEDALMCSFFYGMPILFENNKYDIYRHFEMRGFEGYLLDRPKNSYQKDSRYHSRNKAKGIPSNKDTNNLHAGLLQVYVYAYIGEDEETGEMGDFPFKETLKQLAQFSVETRGDLDGAVSLGLAIQAVDGKETKMSSEKEKRQPLVERGKITITY